MGVVLRTMMINIMLMPLISPRLEINGDSAKKRRKGSGKKSGGANGFGGDYEDEDEDERQKRREAELEPLDLPPTKLHMKQLKLLRRLVFLVDFFIVCIKYGILGNSTLQVCQQARIGPKGGTRGGQEKNQATRQTGA